VPAGDARRGARSVAAFREKPPVEEVVQLLGAGALLNTFVLAARAQTLIDLVARHVPACWSALSSSWWCRDRLESAYHHLPRSNFSQDVLEHTDRLRVMPVAAGWSDVGTPERLRRDLLGEARLTG
jgi:mannose-1-phosphate guanylyltransferase